MYGIIDSGFFYLIKGEMQYGGDRLTLLPVFAHGGHLEADALFRNVTQQAFPFHSVGGQHMDTLTYAFPVLRQHLQRLVQPRRGYFQRMLCKYLLQFRALLQAPCHPDTIVERHTSLMVNEDDGFSGMHPDFHKEMSSVAQAPGYLFSYQFPGCHV